MLTEDDKWELARRYGPLAKQSLDALIASLAGLIAEKDVLGMCFLIECADKVLKSAAGEVEKIQQARGYYSGTVQ